MAFSSYVALYVLALLCLTLCRHSEAFCYRGNLVTEKTVSDRFLSYCEYKPSVTSTSNVTIRLLPGSRIYMATDCIDCHCTMQGLRCCGFGTNAGKTGPPPPGCKEILDGCQELWVKVDNETLDCWTGKPFNESFTRKVHPDNVYSREREDTLLTAAIAAKKVKDALSQKNMVTASRMGVSTIRRRPNLLGPLDISLAKPWANLVPGLNIHSSTADTSSAGSQTLSDLVQKLFNTGKAVNGGDALKSVGGATPTSRTWHAEFRSGSTPHVWKHHSGNASDLSTTYSYLHDIFPFLFPK